MIISVNNDPRDARIIHDLCGQEYCSAGKPPVDQCWYHFLNWLGCPYLQGVGQRRRFAYLHSSSTYASTLYIEMN